MRALSPSLRVDFQDVHIGNATTTYMPPADTAQQPITYNHRGQVNVDIVMDYVKEQFPSPEKVLVTGCSAGAIAAGIHGAALSEYYARTSPTTQITVIADAFAMMATDFFIRERIVNWGREVCTLLDLMYQGGGAWGGVEDYGLQIWRGVQGIVSSNGGLTAFVSSFEDKVQRKYYKLMAAFDDESAFEWEIGLRILDRLSAVDTGFVFSGKEHCQTSLSLAMNKAENKDYPAFMKFLTSLFSDDEPIPPPVSCPLCTSEETTGCNKVIGSNALMDNCAVCNEDITRSTCAVNYTPPTWVEGICPTNSRFGHV